MRPVLRVGAAVIRGVRPRDPVLDHVAEVAEGVSAEQVEEAYYTLTYLRGYATLEGQLPEQFDNLVATVFEPLIDAARV